MIEYTFYVCLNYTEHEVAVEGNELLHKRINQLKDEQFRGRISALENIAALQSEQIEILKRGLNK